jgi:hypothetical protein
MKNCLDEVGYDQDFTTNFIKSFVNIFFKFFRIMKES